MKKFFITFLILFCTLLSYAQETFILDDETKRICNQVMMFIYNDILKAKEKYEELKEFDEKALLENSLGIYTLLYHYQSSKEKTVKNDYDFGVTLTSLDDDIFKDQKGYFRYSFPFLKIKFTGFIKTNLNKI